MDNCTIVSNLAQHLDLSMGLDGPPGKLLSMEEHQEGGALLAEQIDSIPENKRASFWSQFAACYLPSLHKTVMSIPTHPKDFGSIFSLIQSLHWLDQASQSYYGCRFVREHKEKAVAFHLFLREIAYNLPSDFTKSGGTSRILLISLNDSYTDLMWCYPEPKIPVPVLTQSQKTILRRLVIFADREAKRAPSSRPLKNHRDFSRLVDNLCAMGGERDASIQAALDEGIQVWWSCHWEGHKSREEVAGAKLGDGEEMQACSRCLTVRYCSKEHQRQDWKDHKTLCFKASW